MKSKFLLSALMFSYFASSAVLIPYFTLYLSESFSYSEIGILMAIIPMAMIIFQPFWARISDKLGTRWTLLLTLSGALLSTVGLIFSRSFIEFFIVLSLYALFIIPILSLIDRIILASHSKHTCLSANKRDRFNKWGE